MSGTCIQSFHKCSSFATAWSPHPVQLPDSPGMWYILLAADAQSISLYLLPWVGAQLYNGDIYSIMSARILFQTFRTPLLYDCSFHRRVCEVGFRRLRYSDRPVAGGIKQAHALTKPGFWHVSTGYCVAQTPDPQPDRSGTSCAPLDGRSLHSTTAQYPAEHREPQIRHPIPRCGRLLQLAQGGGKKARSK